MVGELQREEVEAKLSINSVHCHEVGRVTSISEELDAESWNHVGFVVVNWRCRGESCEASVRAFENASILMVAHGLPGDLADVTNGVNGLLAASPPVAWELVAR